MMNMTMTQLVIMASVVTFMALGAAVCTMYAAANHKRAKGHVRKLTFYVLAVCGLYTVLLGLMTGGYWAACVARLTGYM